MIIPLEVFKDGDLKYQVSTDVKGRFNITDMPYGTYQMQAKITSLIKIDTSIILDQPKMKVTLILDDRPFRRYIDSVEIAKYPYNADSARADIAKGDIKVLTYGLPILADYERDSIAQKYGFRYVVIAACVISHYQANAAESYNEVVYDYLDQVNPRGWQERMEAELMTLFRQELRRRSNK